MQLSYKFTQISHPETDFLNPLNILRFFTNIPTTKITDTLIDDLATNYLFSLQK